MLFSISIQNAMRLRHIVASSAQQTSPTLTNKRYDYQKEHNKMCVLIFSKNFIWHISHKEKLG